MRQPKVALIHGAGCNGLHMASLAHDFAQAGFDPILITLPGHGPGEDPSGYSLKDYVDYVRDVLNKKLVSGETLSIVGHSMGGDVAQMLAAEDARVIGIALLASLSNAGIMLGFSLIMRMLLPHYLWPMLTGRKVRFRDKDLRELLLSEVADPEKEIPTFGFESGRALLDAALAQPIFWRKRPMKNPFGRVLVIAGERDKTMVLRVERAIARFYGRVPVVIKGAGHMMPQEACSDRVSRHLVRWASKIAFKKEEKQKTPAALAAAPAAE